MSNEARGNPGSDATATAPANSVPAPAASSSTIPDLQSRVNSVSDPRALQALMAELRNPKPTPPTPMAPAPDGNEETPATPETPAAEPATAEPATETALEAPPEADPQNPPADDPDTIIDPDEPIKPVGRARLRVSNEVDQWTLAFKARNPDWTFEQATAAAKEKLGITPAPTTAPAPATEPTEPALPVTVDGVNASIKSLQQQRLKLLQEFNYDEAGKLDEQIDRLQEHRSDLKMNAAQEAQQDEARYNTQFAASENRARDVFPFVNDENSLAFKKLVEIDAELQATEDPRLYDPNRPFLVAQMAAAALNIAPRSPGAKAPAPVAKPATPQTPKTAAPKVGALPSGASRTAPAPAVNPVTEQISKISTLQDLQNFRKKSGYSDFTRG